MQPVHETPREAPAAPSGWPSWFGCTGCAVCAVGCVLLSLLIMVFPAIHAVREAARRSACRSRLKGIGLAVANYEETHRAYPPGVRVLEVALSRPGTTSCWHWYAHIMPFMEEQPIHMALGVDDSDEAVWHETIMETGPVTQRGLYLQCPSDLGSQFYTVQPVAGPGTFQYRSNYAAAHNAGPFELVPGKGTGAFGVNTRRSLWDIGDGTSNVIFIGEKGTGTTARPRSAAAPYCVPRLSGPESLTACFVTDAPINHTSESFEERSRGMSSAHSGGAHAAFGDGTIRWISDKIDSEQLRRLISIADGTPVDVP